MIVAKAHAERRAFGRRTACLHGWVVVDGRPRLACLVRNVAEGGALLEFAAPKSMPFRFRLVIECKGFEALCETRHHQDQWMGVRFVEFEKVAAPIALWSPDVDDAWKGRTAHRPTPFGRAR
jgi:hypothetical protein